MRPPRLEARRERGRQGREDGRMAEVIATLLLMVKGYQILGFRLRTKQGEIDLLARRGRWLCIVEVKRRATVELALQAITPVQRQRLLLAGRALAERRPALRQLDMRLDLIALAPGRFPRHLRNILADSVPPDGREGT
ncbi:MAG TPA: YraN family protein [Caulobacteraceae bacterium]